MTDEFKKHYFGNWPTRKYVLRSGWVISRNDGQRHYITCAQLIELYKVDPKECLIEPDMDFPQNRYWKPPLGAIYLSPRSDENYVLPLN